MKISTNPKSRLRHLKKYPKAYYCDECGEKIDKGVWNRKSDKTFCVKCWELEFKQKWTYIDPNTK